MTNLADGESLRSASGIIQNRLRAVAANAKLALDKKDVAAAMRSIDPQAEALAKLVSPVVDAEPDTVRTALALLIELGSGFGPWLVAPSAPAKRKDESAPAQTPAAVTLAEESPAAEAVQAIAAPVTDAMPVTIEGAAGCTVAHWAAGSLVKGRGTFLAASDLFAAYNEHCTALGLDLLSPNAFGRAMTAAGYERMKVGGAMRYEGVAFATMRLGAIRLAVSNERRALGPMATSGV